MEVSLLSKFSSRFHWDFRPNRLTEALNDKRCTGARILDLTESNPTHAGFTYPPEIVANLGDPRILNYEPAPAGILTAREAVAAYYSRRHHPVDPSHLLLTASTSEAYAYLFKLLCEPGDQVLVPRPSYPLFEFLAHMESVEIRQYPLAYHGGWGIDFDALAAAITPRTRAIVLVNPNNPTGSYVKKSELESLIQLAGAHDLALISDEVFSDYALSADPTRVETLSGVDGVLTFSMSGLSKIAGLPQMKLGWIAVSGPGPQRREALEKLEWIADTYLSVGAPVQYSAERLLHAGEDVQQQIRRRTSTHLEHARKSLKDSVVNILKVEGGWYITLQVPRVRSEEERTLNLLAAESVLVQPGFFFDFQSEAYLIVSLLTHPDIFHEGITRLRRHIQSASSA